MSDPCKMLANVLWIIVFELLIGIDIYFWCKGVAWWAHVPPLLLLGICIQEFWRSNSE